MGDETDNPVQSCPGPCDAVIPIVYYNQPITIPYSAITDQMNFGESLVIDTKQSVQRTFTKPNTSPPLEISQTSSAGVKVKGLGHAGVAFVNGITGDVAYYEYGRYDPANYGEVRYADGLVKISGGSPQRLSVSFGDDHNPTAASFNTLLTNLTKTNRGPYAFWATYTKLANGAYDIMKTFAELRMQQVSQRTSAAYNINSNHCFTFALEVATEAGLRADVAAAPDLRVILVARNGATLDAPEDLAVGLPSRQMLELQKKYRALNVDSSGKIQGNFIFPQTLNAK